MIFFNQLFAIALFLTITIRNPENILQNILFTIISNQKTLFLTNLSHRYTLVKIKLSAIPT